MSAYASRRSSYYGGKYTACCHPLLQLLLLSVGSSHLAGLQCYWHQRLLTNHAGHEQNRHIQAGYYGSRQAARESWVENNGYGPPTGHPRARYGANRMQSDPGWNRYNSGLNGVYPTQSYQQSSATINTGGSGGSHSEHYSTDPSSENSSIERAAPPPPQHDLGEQYGFSGFGGGPILEEYGGGSRGYPTDGYLPHYPTSSNVPPQVPTKIGPPAPRNKPNAIKLTPSQSPPSGTAGPNTLQRNNTEKRKSWFKRRFSKA